MKQENYVLKIAHSVWFARVFTNVKSTNLLVCGNLGRRK